MKYKTWRLIFTSLTSTCPNLSAPYLLLLLNRKYYYSTMYYLLHTCKLVMIMGRVPKTNTREIMGWSQIEQGFSLHFVSIFCHIWWFFKNGARLIVLFHLNLKTHMTGNNRKPKFSVPEPSLMQVSSSRWMRDSKGVIRWTVSRCITTSVGNTNSS